MRILKRGHWLRIWIDRYACLRARLGFLAQVRKERYRAATVREFPWVCWPTKSNEGAFVGRRKRLPTRVFNGVDAFW